MWFYDELNLVKVKLNDGNNLDKVSSKIPKLKTIFYEQPLCWRERLACVRFILWNGYERDARNNIKTNSQSIPIAYYNNYAYSNLF